MAVRFLGVGRGGGMGKPPSKAPSKGMASTWTLVAVLCLVGLVVTSGLAIY